MISLERLNSQLSSDTTSLVKKIINFEKKKKQKLYILCNPNTSS